MIKVKDGYAKLIGTTYAGSASRVLLSNGGDHILGNASGNIPLNNGTVNTNLNADLLDSKHASAFALVASSNNLIHNANEFTFVPSEFSGKVWLNYRTTGGTNGAITQYNFGNGKGSTSGVTLVAETLQGKLAYTYLTGSGTTANQAIVSTGTANGWTLKTLGSNAFNSTAYLPLAGGLMDSTAYISWNNGSDGNDVSDWNITTNGLRIISSAATTTKAPTQYSTGLHVKGRYGFLLASQGGSTSNEFFIKNVHNTIWNTLIHSNNYTNYTVKKDGTGASGTWGISISGTATNADKLDGYHETDFFRYRGDIDVSYVDIDVYTSGDSRFKKINPGIYVIPRSGYSEMFISFAKNTGSTSSLELKTSYSNNDPIYVRKVIDANRVSGAWKQLAFTDSDITGNAASATKVYVNQHTGNDIEYPLVWSNQQNNTVSLANLLFKSYSNLTYNPKHSRITATTFRSGSSTFLNGSLELYGGTPYIDFHYDNSTSDYTSRIIEGLEGLLTVTGKLRVGLAYTTSTNYKFYVNGSTYSSSLDVSSKAIIDNNGYFYPADTNKRTVGVYGVYSPYKVGHIWSIGTGYRISNDGSNTGNMFGLVYFHTNWSADSAYNKTTRDGALITEVSTYAGGHQIALALNGKVYVSLGDYVWSRNGFKKNGSSDSYVLLGGGGHKSISSFQTTYDSRYVIKSGDTMTGRLTISTTITDHTKPTDQCLVINSAAIPKGTTLTLKNSPGIGFHIASRSWGSLVFNGTFNFINNDATSFMSVKASKFITDGGTASLFVKGDGSLDSTSYATTSSLGNYLPLAGGTMKNSAVITLPASASIVHTTATSSNAVASLVFYKGNSKDSNYDYPAQIGWHNTGDTDGAIYLVPNPQDSSPWGGGVGLYIGKTLFKWNNNTIIHAGNYTTYTVKKDGTGATGTWGINITGNANSATKLYVNQHTGNDIEYPLVWSNLASTTSTLENQLYKSYAKLLYNPKYNRITASVFKGNLQGSLNSIFSFGGGANNGKYYYVGSITLTNAWLGYHAIWAFTGLENAWSGLLYVGFRLGNTTTAFSGVLLEWLSLTNPGLANSIKMTYEDSGSSRIVRLYILLQNYITTNTVAITNHNGTLAFSGTIVDSYSGTLVTSSVGPISTSVSADRTMTMVPQNNNEINFGGSHDSTTVYIGYKKIDTKPIPTKFVFGGNDGTATLKSSGFIKKDGTEAQLLRADGGVATFNWSGQSGQPTWLWGGNSKHTYYVYDPSNFSVKEAVTASYATSAPAMTNYGGTGNTTKIKIKVNSTKSWMLSFVVTIYLGYRSSKVMVSGYNYGTSYWYEPEAVLLGDSDNNTSLNVYFGYDSARNLWVGFDGGRYTGVSISDVTNGYTQIESFKDLFTISNVSSLTTIQKTITAKNTVSNADLLDGVHANGLLTDLSSGTTNKVSITVGGATKNITTLYASYLCSVGTVNPLTGRTLDYGNVYSYRTNTNYHEGAPTTYTATIGFGLGAAGTVEICGEWTSGRGLWARALRDVDDDWYDWDRILTEATYSKVLDSRYVNVSGDTMTGNLTMSGGSELRLKAHSSASTDPGDIVFQNSSGTEIGRIYKPAGVNEFYVRFSGSDTSKVLLHSENYTTYTDSKYVNVSGDTMTGNLTMSNSSLYFGSNGTGASTTGNETRLPSHIYRNVYDTSGNVYDHYYNTGYTAATNSLANLRVKSGSTFKTLSFGGNGTFTWNGNTVWHAGNDGSGSGLDADTVDGLHVSKAGNTKPWGTIVSIGTDGVSEMGKYIDFHYDNTTGSDYSTRLLCSSVNNVYLQLPSSSGTLALTHDIDLKLDAYVKKSGDWMSGTLYFNDNLGLFGQMAGSTDHWEIKGAGTSDNGRLKIQVHDNATTDAMDFEFVDWSGDVYRPLTMTGLGAEIIAKPTPGSWISGKTEASIKYQNLTAIDSSSFWKFYSMKSQSGNVVCYGGLGNTIGFYGYYAATTANRTDWNFTVNTSNGNWTASASLYAAHFYENSDEQLKTNIQEILNSDKMPIIKEFDWKEDNSHSYGLIAQELEEQGYSELVSIKDNGYKTVNYSAALSLIVGKLQVKIKELEKEIENLKNKN